jgi:hypothetical protein
LAEEGSVTIYQRRIPEHAVPDRRLGRHVEHDPRSRSFSVEPRLTTEVFSRSWTRTTRAFNQGDLGSCTGNAMEGCLATAPHKQAGRRYSEASAVRLYKLATVLDGFDGIYPPDDTGSSTLGVMKAARQLGKIGRYEWCFTTADVLRALSQHGPVCIGIGWYEGFDFPDRIGMLTVGGDVRGGHELELCGVNAESRTVTGFNSWGPSWGYHGQFQMVWDTLDRLLHEDGEAAVAIP